MLILYSLECSWVYFLDFFLKDFLQDLHIIICTLWKQLNRLFGKRNEIMNRFVICTKTRIINLTEQLFGKFRLILRHSWNNITKVCTNFSFQINLHSIIDKKRETIKIINKKKDSLLPYYTIFIQIPSNFFSVFFTLNDVNRTVGFGCQHSCMILARVASTSSSCHLEGTGGRISFTHTTACISSKLGSNGT